MDKTVKKLIFSIGMKQEIRDYFGYHLVRYKYTDKYDGLLIPYKQPPAQDRQNFLKATDLIINLKKQTFSFNLIFESHKLYLIIYPVSK